MYHVRKDLILKTGDFLLNTGVKIAEGSAAEPASHSSYTPIDQYLRPRMAEWERRGGGGGRREEGGEFDVMHFLASS